MKDELLQLRNRLQEERQGLARRLKEIDDDLASIKRVVTLVDGQKLGSNQSQLDLINTEGHSGRFAMLKFKNAVPLLLDDDPGKFWAPREIAEGLLKNGFKTKAKDFGASVRTMLLKMRECGDISATKTKDGWLYGPSKEKGSTLNGVEPSGGLRERLSEPT